MKNILIFGGKTKQKHKHFNAVTKTSSVNWSAAGKKPKFGQFSEAKRKVVKISLHSCTRLDICGKNGSRNILEINVKDFIF